MAAEPRRDPALEALREKVSPEDLALFERVLRQGRPESALGRLLDLRNALKDLEGDPVWLEKPATPEEFLRSDAHLGSVYRGQPAMWPAVEEIFLEVASPDSEVRELVLMGASGWGKSFLAKHLAAYWLHLLGCLRDPATWLGLAPGTDIYLGNASVTGKQAKRAVFNQVRALVDSMPWFRERFPREKDVETELRFTRGISYVPGSSSVTEVLGLCFLFGIVDEMNTIVDVGLSRTEKERGEKDRAHTLYEQLRERMDNRFPHPTRRPRPLLVLVGAAEYSGDFLERFVAERAGQSGVRIVHMTQWQARGIPSTPGFRVSLGGHGKVARILGDAESTGPEETVLDVPEQYRLRFERDLSSACRQIAGRPVAIASGFMPPDVIARSIRPALGNVSTWSPLPKILYASTEPLLLQPGWRNPYPDAAVYAHGDMALSGCRAAMAGIRPTGRILKLIEGEHEYGLATIPEAELVFLVAVQGTPERQVDLSEFLALVSRLTEAGVRFAKISFDQFASQDLIQRLKAMWISAALRSVDRTPSAYVSLRLGLAKGALQLPPEPLLLRELAGLVHDDRGKKVDHASGGSKDMTDSIAGAFSNLLEAESRLAAVRTLGAIVEAMGERTPEEVAAQEEVDREIRLDLLRLDLERQGLIPVSRDDVPVTGPFRVEDFFPRDDEDGRLEGDDGWSRFRPRIGGTM